MMLYHVNAGFPVVSPASELITPSIEARPRDAEAEKERGNWSRFLPPTPASRSGSISTSSGRAPTAGPRRGGEPRLPGRPGDRLRPPFPARTVPLLHEWKMIGQGLYVVGTEPGNVNPLARETLRRENRLPMIAPGERKGFELDSRCFPASRRSSPSRRKSSRCRRNKMGFRKARMNRLFAKTGKCFDVAIDHGFFNERAFLAGIEDLDKAVADARRRRPRRDPAHRRPGAAPAGHPRQAASPRSSCAPTSPTSTARSCRARLFSRMIDDAVEQALALDAACVVVNLLPHSRPARGPRPVHREHLRSSSRSATATACR